MRITEAGITLARFKKLNLQTTKPYEVILVQVTG